MMELAKVGIVHRHDVHSRGDLCNPCTPAFGRRLCTKWEMNTWTVATSSWTVEDRNWLVINGGSAFTDKGLQQPVLAFIFCLYLFLVWPL